MRRTLCLLYLPYLSTFGSCHHRCCTGVQRSTGHGEDQHGTTVVSLRQAAVFSRQRANDSSVQVNVWHRSWARPPCYVS